MHIALGPIGGEPALIGYIGADATDAAARVFVVTLDNGPLDGAYSVTLLKTLDHPIHGTEDSLVLSIGFVATNSHGDIANASLTISVNDDSPSVAAIADRTLIETLVPAAGDSTGDFVAQSTGAVSLNVSWGADNNNSGSFDRNVAFLTTAAPSGLTSDGVAVAYSLNADGTVLTASAGARTVFTVTLSDTANGSFTFNLLDNLDHAAGGGKNDLPLSFAVRATDADGDPVDTGFTIHVTGDVRPLRRSATRPSLKLIPTDSDPTGAFVASRPARCR